MPTDRARAWLTRARVVSPYFNDGTMRLIADAVPIIRELLAVVERCPKDAEGNPVVIGDTRWVNADGKYITGGIVEVEVGTLLYCGEFGCVAFELSDLHNTSAAAESARKDKP